MDFLIRHFSILAIAATLANAIIISRRIPAFVEARGADPREATRLVWGGAAVLSLYYIAINYVVLTAGLDRVECFLPSLHPRSTSEYEMTALWFGFVAAGSLWIWFGGGAALVARNAPLFERSFRPDRQLSPKTVRLYCLLWLVVSVVAPLALYGSRPDTLSCASSHDAPAASSAPR